MPFIYKNSKALPADLVPKGEELPVSEANYSNYICTFQFILNFTPSINLISLPPLSRYLIIGTQKYGKDFTSSSQSTLTKFSSSTILYTFFRNVVNSSRKCLRLALCNLVMTGFNGVRSAASANSL